MKCKDNYVLNDDKKICFNGPVGCLISLGENNCKICNEDRYLVNGLCESTSISFCEIPENS